MNFVENRCQLPSQTELAESKSFPSFDYLYNSSNQGVLFKVNEETSDNQKQTKLASIFDSPRVSFAQPVVDDEFSISSPTRRKLAYPQVLQSLNGIHRDNDDDDHETIVTNNTTPDRMGGPEFDCFPSGMISPSAPSARYFSPARAMVGTIRGGPLLMSPVTQKSPGDGDTKSTRPRMWTLEEDQILMNAVQSARQPMKWPNVGE
mmetsp:Transcript_24664/g.72140  ORF Transcript_24664/g.72140 Transcript_24664/m.72140 type:complete len:205 (+) Transcript_24664:410-1024(+)